MLYKKRTDLAVKQIGDELVIIDSRVGKSVHRLNEVGIFIWNLIDKVHTDELLVNLVDEFDVDSVEAKQDLLDFIVELESLNLLEKGHE